jgi:hypothetical protein
MKDVVFSLHLIKLNDFVGTIYVIRHPQDNHGAEVHLEISTKWRRKWLSRGLKNRIMQKLVVNAKKHQIKILYSTALTAVSPRLLEFFGFIEYYEHEPKKYYYFNCEE